MPSDDRDTLSNSYFAVAAMSFLVYDTLIHIGDEVEYIWCGRRSWIKYAYAFIRHVPYLAEVGLLEMIAPSHSQSAHPWRTDQCRIWLIFQLTLNETLTVVVEAVFIARIYAMFKNNMLIVATVLSLYLAEIIAMITVIALSIPRMDISTSACFITRTPPIWTSYWIISLSFETILFALTMSKFIALRNYGGRESFMFLLVRDGTWAYALIFLIMLLNTLMYHLVDNPLAGVCFLWQLSVMSFAGSHVLLNLRRFAVRSPQSDSLWTVEEFETIQYACPPLSQWCMDTTEEEDSTAHE
ncbi:uncharacterized protein LAESUDRAFT_693883 [Laetiporus sulphureus 93-53]|uniref:DUF6533 domain-containing protein n=1 Tax=Laetiporus sulphureus 93-53 TaxID=1314785 RepID=A0A165GGS1_9APHY|nr:uncharacterized protein LAESUDRAFT_693883 [Laetiporus sulphureus 93-53]KZT10322.1 hypothetical protein LAESUDRAFT_693883 [Laetiporus sulphureus 93-53]